MELKGARIANGWYHGVIDTSPRMAQVVPQQPGRDAIEDPLTPRRRRTGRLPTPGR
jgi:hypothetical protein